jgi:hypothetical protein
LSHSHAGFPAHWRTGGYDVRRAGLCFVAGCSGQQLRPTHRSSDNVRCGFTLSAIAVPFRRSWQAQRANLRLSSCPSPPGQLLSALPSPKAVIAITNRRFASSEMVHREAHASSRNRRKKSVGSTKTCRASARGRGRPHPEERAALPRDGDGWRGRLNSLDSFSAKVQPEFDRDARARRSGSPFQNSSEGTRLSVPRRSFRPPAGAKGTRAVEDTMISATEYRLMAAEHHHLAGM